MDDYKHILFDIQRTLEKLETKIDKIVDRMEADKIIAIFEEAGCQKDSTKSE
jgi:hypothetical protein